MSRVMLDFLPLNLSPQIHKYSRQDILETNFRPAILEGMYPVCAGERVCALHVGSSSLGFNGVPGAWGTLVFKAVWRKFMCCAWLLEDADSHRTWLSTPKLVGVQWASLASAAPIKLGNRTPMAFSSSWGCGYVEETQAGKVGLL